MSAFRIEPHTHADKHFVIQGPHGLLLYVDYDDVWHEQVDALAEAMVAELNETDHSLWDAAIEHIVDDDAEAL